MSYQALARKWRPRDFDAIVGQEHVVRALANAFERDRLHHAYLFSGTRGVGKTTIARIFAKCLNCERGPAAKPCGACGVCREIDEGRHVDLIEVDAASRARVEETRDLLDNVPYAPARGRSKVYLIDEVHMFSRHSFNALLKTLEEPPGHVKFLLATTDPQRLPVTIVSRCLQFGLRRLSVGEITSELDRITRAEEIEAEPAALQVLARGADGSMRDALSLLDQAAAYGAGRVVASEVRDLLGVTGRERLFALLDALAACDAPAMLGALDRLAEEAVDFEAILAEVIEALGRIAALQVAPAGREDDEEVDALRAFASRISPEALQLYYQIGLLGRRDLPYAPHPRGGFEMTMLRMVAFAPAPEPGPAPEASSAAGGAIPSAPIGAPPRREGARAAACEPAGAGNGPPTDRAEPGGGSSNREAPPASSGLRPGAPTEPGGDPDRPLPPGSGREGPPAFGSVQSGPDRPPPRSARADERRPIVSGNETPPPSPPARPDEAPVQPRPGDRPLREEAPSPPTLRDEGERGNLAPADWPEACRQLGLRGMAGQLAANCVVRECGEKVVTLQLRPGQAQLLNDSARGTLESALCRYLGRPIRLRVDVTDQERESPAERRAREEREGVERAALVLRSLPDVRFLFERMGGDFVPDSIRPLT